MSPVTSQVRLDCRGALEGRVETLSPLRNGTLLVTGGTGFVGTWLAEMAACLNDEHGFNIKLILLARGTEKFRAAYPHLSTRRDIQLIRSDVRNRSELPRETNWLVHAAASPDNRFHSSSPVDAMSVIGEGTSAVIAGLDLCSDFRRMLNLSSGLVYGPQPLTLDRMAESHAWTPLGTGVSSAYAEAKRFSEILCAAARSQKRLPVATARLFAFVGPYQSLDSPWAVNNFLNDALSGNAIRIQGDGETARSYMYGSDLAFWTLRMLTAETQASTWNLGSPFAAKLKDVAALIAEHIEPRPEVRLNAALNGKAQNSRFVPDTEAAAALGLDIRVQLPDAIERTVRWNLSIGHAHQEAR